MALQDIIAFDREALGWAKKETTPFTEIKVASANQFLIASEVSPKQDLGFIEDKQRRNSYSRVSRVAGRYEPGQAELTVYVKPSGTLDVAPDGNEFLEGVWGREVITASTKVEYFLQRTTDPLPTYSIWIKTGHFLYRMIGTVINVASFPMKADNSDDSVSQGKYSLLFAELKWTGTDQANQTIGGTPQATLIVLDATKFTTGGYVEVGAQTNGGAGFQVTGVNVATNTLTLSPTIANVTSGDTVKPWIPAAQAEVGAAVHGRLGIATLGGANLPLLSGEIKIDNQFKMLNEEKNGLDFANRVVRKDVRKITVKAEVYFDANQAKWFYNAKNQVRGDLVFPWGNTATKRWTITAKNVELSSPDVGGPEEKIITLTGDSFASTALDDEVVGLLN